MIHFKTLALISAATISMAACSTTGNMERNAAAGAAIGAVAGAVIGNNTGEGDASTGAAIGAVVGGAGGAYTGYKQDQMQTNQLYDEQAGRYYSVDPRTGKSYWANGDFRG